MKSFIAIAALAIPLGSGAVSYMVSVHVLEGRVAAIKEIERDHYTTLVSLIADLKKDFNQRADRIEARLDRK